MRRRPLFFWLACGLVVIGRAASAPGVAELEQKLAQAAPTDRSALSLALAYRLEDIDVERAVQFAQDAQRTATTTEQKLDATIALASFLRTRGDYAEAMKLATEGLAETKNRGDDPRHARFLYIIARTQWSLADYPASVASFLETIRLAESLGDRALLCDAHTGISTIYDEFRQPEQAKPHLERARQLAEDLGDQRRLGDYYKVYGNWLVARGDHAGAREAHEKSRQIHEQAGNERGVADALQNLAELAETADDLSTARDDCTRAVGIYERLGLKRHLTNAERQLGRVLAKQGRLPEALRHLQTSLALAQELGGRAPAANAWRELATTYEMAGDLRNAIDAQRHLQAETDALFGEKSRQQIAALNARYEAERRQQEIALLRGEQARKEAELERTRWRSYGLAGALVLGVVTLGAVVSRQRLKLRAERRVLEETRAARETAEEADRVKTRFLGIASHDIRGPLGNIAHLTTALRQEPPTASALAEHCDLIGSEVQRVICLVEDLITTAALESGRMELRLAPLDLADVAQEVVNSLRWQADAKRQTIAFVQPPAGTGRLNGDAARLQQIIANLLSNAIKFSPPGEVITVRLARDERFVTLAVRDRGAGIAEEDIPRLFAPFQRLATHPTASESSHGLGLSIAQEIARRHGGQVRVQSQPGDGSTFTIELPV